MANYAFLSQHLKKNPAFWWTDDNRNTIKWSFADLSDKSKRFVDLFSKKNFIWNSDPIKY